MEIRNFSIISHVDHGKSTLADRFLEITGAVSKEKMRPQFLDAMDLERERGITIKMHPMRIEFDSRSLEVRNLKLDNPNSRFVLNLVDTPGHVDFSYEVSRSLAAVEGAVLLVSAVKGIQAQTLANLEMAQKQNLIIIPVVNKIDLAQANTEKTLEEMANLLKIDKKNVLKISAKLGTNIDAVLEEIIKKIPAPKRETNKPFRALIFDSKYDPYKGIMAYVRIVDGEIKKDEKIKFLAGKITTEIKELGYFKPEFFPQEKLSSGEIGYIATGIKKPGKIKVGDTIIKFEIQKQESGIKPLPGYKEPKPVIFSNLYPENPDDFDLLKGSLEKLRLNDPSFVFAPETKETLGRGFRCGFLGTLHAEVVSERLRREFGSKIIISSPSVIYKFDGKRYKEPWSLLKVITPVVFMGKILDFFKAKPIKINYLGSEKVVLVYKIPLREVVANLYDKIKNLSQGFASMNYKILDFRESDLVRLEILVAGQKQEAFSKIVPRDRAYLEGKKIVRKLKEILPRQQFSVALQAQVEGKIIARETLSASRKNVTAPLYGGDYSRKKKLLERQKKGKKKLKEKGALRIPLKVFLDMLK